MSTGNQDRPVIHWFRQDLRISDNPALCAAAETDAPLLAVYVLDRDSPELRTPGSASLWWLHQSLTSLGRSLQDLGVRLLLRTGPAAEVIESVVAETGAGAVYFGRAYYAGAASIETELRRRLGESVELRAYPGYLLYEPERIASADGSPYRVFTPFHKATMRATAPSEPLPGPRSVNPWQGRIHSDRLEDWRLQPRQPDWAAGFHDHWRIGEDAAQRRLETFLDDAAGRYKNDRNRPDLVSTSRLSPHLRLGEISPRQVWHQASARAVEKSVATSGIEAFLRQLIWREFSNHLLFHWPRLPDRPLREEFVKFPWRRDDEALRRWQLGRTGFPIVDAGMRELWATGWIHNRVRMIVASFLVKDLLIDWREGEAWFWDTLVDADLANNSASWQWVAGSGTDAAPFFRIFNPHLQARKFDPEGKYLRRWLPELADLPQDCLHDPHSSGIDIDYPEPLVDHAAARERALAAFQSIKKD